MDRAQPVDWTYLQPPLRALPEGITDKYVPVNDLIVHFLDAHPKESPVDGTKHPIIVLIHGFPELAYSWRKVMHPLAQLGFRVVAPDLRGFGRTVPNPSASGYSANTVYPYKYDDPIAQFSFPNLARDIVALVYALGYERVACIMGHDSGSITASSCALIRPDLFRSVVLMSAPFLGTPNVPFDLPTYASANDVAAVQQPKAIHSGLALDAMLARLDPPMMYYQHYYSLPYANIHMHKELSLDELRDFFRAYYHIKSACWPDSSSSSEDVQKYTTPRMLTGMRDMAYLPPYYMMPRGQGMPAVVGARLPCGQDLERSRAWINDEELGEYALEYFRTGFQGGLNRYRIATQLGRATDSLDSISASEEDHISELALFSGKKIEVPVLFVAGEKDWGPYQYPGAFEKMRNLCPLMKEGSEGIVFIKDSGHWVQQENPVDLLVVLENYLKSLNI